MNLIEPEPDTNTVDVLRIYYNRILLKTLKI